MLPSPSTVRMALRRQHEELRQILFEADRLGRLVLQGNANQLPLLRASARSLAAALNAHMDAEEQWAVPHLYDTDAWGPLRARHLQEEHEAQRAGVSALVRLEEGEDGAELANGLRALCASLLEDMRREDRELLGENLLRDDVISIDQSDG